MADLKAPLFKSDGTSSGEVELDAEIFGIEPNLDVLHQVVTAQLASQASRIGIHQDSVGGTRRWP